MKSSGLFWVLPILLVGCRDEGNAIEEFAEPQTETAVERIAEIELSNPSTFARPDTLVSLSLNELGVTAGPVQVWADDETKPTQLIDDDGDGDHDRLVFLTGLKAAETRSFVINDRLPSDQPASRAQAEVSIKEGGEWQGEVYVGGAFKNVDQLTNPPQYTDHSEYIRYEGPGIESDLVGYRVYLDWRNGFDIFGKKKPGLVLQDIGQDGYDSYHEMADWGADILKVGTSLGMGGYGYWDGEKTVLVSDVAERSVSILSSGPIYSSFAVGYKGWNTGAQTVDLEATLSMQAGSPMVDVKLVTSEPLDNMAIGLVAHPGTELLTGELKTGLTSETLNYVASFGQQTLFDDMLGMVIIYRKNSLKQQTRDDNSYVLVMEPSGTELSYAFGALWSGQEGGIQTKEELEAFLLAELERRTQPPRVRLKTAKSDTVTALDALEISSQLAISEIKRRGDSLAYGGWDSVRGRASGWTYTTGLLMEAMDDVATATANEDLAAYAKRTMDSYLGEDGAIHGYSMESFNIDNINSGKMLQRLYKKHGDEKYLKAINTLAKQLADHPRTSEGAFWHKKRYPHQLWLDGVYMGMPFLAGVGVMEGDEHKTEEAAREFTIARSHTRDAETGLYYHAWDEAKEQSWADPETGQSQYFWGRGLGWYAMALVDILDVIPAEKTDLREPLITNIRELADDLLKYQDKTGVWYQIMDMPDAPGNYREASGSAMFTYFFAKAVNRRYLPGKYAMAARKAYAGLVREFITVYADGSFNVRSIAEVAGLGYGRDGSYYYYMSERVVNNDPKGLAPAIMAGVQVAELKNQSAMGEPQ